MNPSQSFDAAEASSIPEGGSRTVEWQGQRLALFHLDGAFHAIDDACPHRGAALGEGWRDGDTVLCPLHGWAFHIKSGACLTRPDRPVRSYRTEVRDGRVWIILSGTPANP